MPAILRHPRFADPVPGYLAEAEALDRAEEREQCMVWQIKAARRWQAIKAACNFLVAIACVGAVVTFVWSMRVGEP